MKILSRKLGNFCLKNNIVITTAESCTAGLIAATIAQTPGSSAWLESGFVVYSAKAKNSILEVSLDTIKEHDITSTEVSSEMAWGALKKSTANVALAVTGVAGPSGGTDEIPVGTVCMSWIMKANNEVCTHDEKKVFKGSRNQIRQDVVKYILEQLMKYYTEDFHKV